MKRYWSWMLCAPFLLPILLLGVLIAPLLVLICLPFWIRLIFARERSNACRGVWTTEEAERTPADVGNVPTSLLSKESHEGVKTMNAVQEARAPLPEHSAKPEPITIDPFTAWNCDLNQHLAETRWTFLQPVTAAERAHWFKLCGQYQQEVRTLLANARSPEDPEREVGE